MEKPILTKAMREAILLCYGDIFKPMNSKVENNSYPKHYYFCTVQAQVSGNWKKSLSTFKPNNPEVTVGKFYMWGQQSPKVNLLHCAKNRNHISVFFLKAKMQLVISLWTDLS